MKVTELDMGHSKVTAVISKNHMNPFGGIHGGVYSSLLDTAAYWSGYCNLGQTQGLVTIDLKVDLLAPVPGNKVYVTGKLLKPGRTLFLTQARMFSQEDKLLAHATSKLMVTDNKQTIDDAVDYMHADKLPPKFLRRSYAV